MKSKQLLLIFSLLFTAAATAFTFNSPFVGKVNKFQKRSAGCANMGIGDRSGSPISVSSCSACHSGGSFNTAMTIVVKDSAGVPVTAYIPGAAYSVEYTVSGTGASNYGFQSVTLNGSNSQAGAFSNPTANTQISNIGLQQYMEHTTAAFGTGSYTFGSTWLAPSNGTGNVSFYATGLTVNSNGTTSGDDPSAPMSISLTELSANINYSSPAYCTGDADPTPTQTGVGSGVYSSTAGLDIDPVSGLIDISNSAAGQYTVTYTYTGGTTTDVVSIGAPTASTDTQVACGSYTWIDGNTYSSNNTTATHTLANASGCDSVVTLNLTINPNSSSTDVQSACGSFGWIDGVTYFASNNTATHTVPSSSGCDSTITLDLTLYPISTTTDIQTSCDSIVWIDGNTYSSNNNTATHLLAGAGGCDSLVMLDLTVTNVDVGVNYTLPSITANSSTGTYQWMDCLDNSIINGETNQEFSPPLNGDFAVIVTDNNCTDTSECISYNEWSVGSLEMLNPLSIYPNPTNGTFNVMYSGIGSPEIQIVNVYGEHVDAIQLINSKTEINLDLAKGIYFVTMNEHCIRLVIQ